MFNRDTGTNRRTIFMGIERFKEGVATVFNEGLLKILPQDIILNVLSGLFLGHVDLLNILYNIYSTGTKSRHSQGRIQGGSWGSGLPPPPPFGGPPNFIKREEMARACARKLRILVLNSYPEPPTPPPFLKSCIRP